MMKIQKLDLLISLYIFCICIAELMGGKTFPLFTSSWLKLNASVAIFVVPLIYGINDIITEVFGRDKARSIVQSGLIIVALISLTTVFFTSLPPSSRFIKSEPAYDAVFQTSARIALSSLTAFAVAEFLDVFIFVKIREKLGKRNLWLRTNVSNIVAQFFDTTLFITLAFYALDRSLNDNIAFLTSIIIPYWLIKCLMSVIETPFVYLGVKWLRGK